jgi:hypothetical protein
MKQSMLKTLLGKFGGEEVAAPEALTSLQAEFDAFKLEASAQTAELSAALETALTAVKEADARVAELSAAVEAAVAEKAAMVAKAAEAKANARKEKIVAAVGTARADALFAATSNLEDAAFDSVIGALVTSASAEASSKLFTEVGVTGEPSPAQAAAPAVESAEMKILREKYAASANQSQGA